MKPPDWMLQSTADPLQRVRQTQTEMTAVMAARVTTA